MAGEHSCGEFISLTSRNRSAYACLFPIKWCSMSCSRTHTQIYLSLDLLLHNSFFVLCVKMAANTGKIEAVVELKSNADKYWGSLRDSTNLFPRAFPHDYKSIEVLEGDGKSAGSIRHITYAEGSPLAKNSTEKIEAVDDEKKWVAYSVIGEDLMKYYKSFKGEFSVTPKGEGSEVKWSCVYEKAHEEVPDPTVIRDFAIKNFKEVDEYVLMDNPSA